MRLSALFPKLDAPDLEIQALTDRPTDAGANALCVCIRGARANGHELAGVAYQNGCRTFVVSEWVDLPADATVLRVSDTRAELARLACVFYGNPSRTLAVIGITGTKGKTTVASLLAQTLSGAGIPCGYIGTNGVSFGDVHRSLANTTPDPLTLQRTLCEMRESGIRAVALEVSSQALYQHRVDGIQFEATVFTNLYSDHVGPTEHPDFDHYKACKHRLFTNFPSRIALFNTDDSNAQEMQENCAAHRILTYALDTTCADYAANNLLPTQSDKGYGISFSTKVDGTPESFSIPLLGKFNASNAIAVLAVAHECFGLSAHAIALALKNAAVNGRTEAFRLASGACAVVDYAHNGESLCKLLTALREYKPSRLICLFGSVGERSQLRRREMGDVAARLCDLAILTSDNPGREDPSAIIADIARAFASTRTPYLAIPDRSDAIRQAVSLTRAGDILVLAGKGHEAYQLIGTEKLPFSDREELILANDSIQSN